MHSCAGHGRAQEHNSEASSSIRIFGQTSSGAVKRVESKGPFMGSPHISRTDAFLA